MSATSNDLGEHEVANVLQGPVYSPSGLSGELAMSSVILGEKKLADSGSAVKEGSARLR
jgi:hypothetical protein